MEFVEDLRTLEDMLERHRSDHREVMNFKLQVDQAISRQASLNANFILYFVSSY